MRYAKYIIFNPRSSEYPRPRVSHLELAAQLENAVDLLDHHQAEAAVASFLALREKLGNGNDIKTIAYLAYQLGIGYKKLALLQAGEPNWRRAMTALEEALDLIHATHDVLAYAIVYIDLGFVYQSLAGFIERNEFLAKAQAAFEKARFFLEQWEKTSDPEADPVNHRLGLYHLGNTYHALAQFTTDEPLYQTAISLYEQVIRSFPPGQLGSVYGLAQYYRGLAHHTLAENGDAGDDADIDPEENRNQARDAYREALTIFTAEDYPVEFSHTQNCLANLYLDFARVHHQEEYLNQTVIASQEVLRALTSKAVYPLGYALILHNLGSACKLYSKVRDDEKLYLWKALHYFESIINIENLPPAAEVLASTHLNVGLIYARMAAINDDLRYLTKAVGFLESALEYYTTLDDPVRCAITQTNLGDAYLTLGKGAESPDNLLKSLQAYREGAKLFRDNGLVADYAGNQSKLGDIYLELAARNPNESDIVNALESYQAGLAVLNQETYPEEYAEIQLRLDEAYQRLEKVREGKE